jgi:hypothetical protein
MSFSDEEWLSTLVQRSRRGCAAAKEELFTIAVKPLYGLSGDEIGRR